LILTGIRRRKIDIAVRIGNLGYFLLELKLPNLGNILVIHHFSNKLMRPGYRLLPEVVLLR